MKEIRTEIIINAPVEKVWDVFSKFEDYPNWNPFIKSISGEMEVGEALEVVMQLPDSNKMTFKARGDRMCRKTKNSGGLENYLFKGLFDGEHYFIFSRIDDNSTRLIHGEKLWGILVPVFKKVLVKTEKGFEMMNEALKAECEEN